jgi:hypothetical protein
LSKSSLEGCNAAYETAKTSLIGKFGAPNGAFNHAMFKAPNTTMTNSAFGKVTATSQWPRTIQMSLKLVF